VLRTKEDGPESYGVPTSYQAAALAIASGILLTSLSQHPVLDLAIDGADQIDFNLFAIKGGGAAHTREKVVSASARRFLVVADESKYAEKLSRPVPVEVLPFASTSPLPAQPAPAHGHAPPLACAERWPVAWAKLSIGEVNALDLLKHYLSQWHPLLSSRG